MTRRQILITGATGFIGQHLCDTIQRDGLNDDRYRFVLLSSRPLSGWDVLHDRRGDDGRYAFAASDVRSSGLTEVDCIIHLGAFTPKDRSESNDVGKASTNIYNTQYLLDRLPPPRRFVFASTIDVYGLYSEPVEESMVCAPATLYGASKLYCEKMLQAWTQQLLAPSTSLAIMRLGHIYGTGEERYRKFIPETIRRLRQGEAPALMTSGRELRAFLHVSDCCRMLLQAGERNDDLGAVNIASDHRYSLHDIARMLSSISEEVTGRKTPAWSAPDGVRGQSVTMNVGKMIINYGREKVDLQEGLREELEHYDDEL